MFRLTVAALLLAGCAVNRSDATYLTLHSDKAPAVVSECIQSAWMENPAGLPALRFAHAEGYTVTMHGESNETVLMADAVPSGNGGSDIVVRRAWWNAEIADQARGCV